MLALNTLQVLQTHVKVCSSQLPGHRSSLKKGPLVAVDQNNNEGHANDKKWVGFIRFRNSPPNELSTTNTTSVVDCCSARQMQQPAAATV